MIAFILYSIPVLSRQQASPEICNSRSWTSEDGTEQFEIDLTEVDGAIKGTHCSIAYNGRYVDCSDEELSIDLRPTGTNTFEGTIKSGYSLTTGKIRLTFDKANNRLHFELLEEPSGVFYFPKDAVME
ncbi:hypothetical protein [Salinimicrobium soli]|uniref:hypothetical protein n=1 Tax=Salinimicrobium soli TaxID=1254399 RepID=UPI003AAE0C04